MGAAASPKLRVPLLGARPAPADDERPRRPWRTICCDVLIVTFWCSLLLLLIGWISHIIHIIQTNGVVEASAAITGINGLDPAIDLRNDLRPTLSPVLNLTIYIKQFDRFATVCIGGRSDELIVSYREAFLGKSAVPRFCVPFMQEDGIATTAWGTDVVVPRFLRDQLAGELEQGVAVLDVVVMDPRYRSDVLACKPRIGGDRGPCEFEED